MKHMQNSYQNASNIHLKQIKYLEQTSKTLAKYATCATSPIYFCNIYMKQLQRTSETFKTLAT
jgi:hypothetical protein